MGGGKYAPPLGFFALISVKMIESTWDLFLKSFLVVADIISKGRGSERASWCTASTQSRQSSTRTWFLPLRSQSYFLFSKPRDIIHVHRLLFQGESKSRGFKGDKGNIEGPGEQQEQQLQGPGQGVIHFFQIWIWYMFICQFFNENPNFEFTSVTKVI